MSTTQRVVRKQLAGAEDLLQGVGTVTQTRGTGSYPIHKLDVPIPMTSIAEMQASSAEFVRIYETDIQYTDYRRIPTATTGDYPSAIQGYWQQMYKYNANAALTFATVAEMKASVQASHIGMVVEWLGYYNLFDGGGNKGVVVAAGAGTDDGGSFFDCDSGVQVQALFANGVGFSSQFGCSDNATDDTTKAQKFLDSALFSYKIFNSGNTNTNTVLHPRSNITIEFLPGAKITNDRSSADKYNWSAFSLGVMHLVALDYAQRGTGQYLKCLDVGAVTAGQATFTFSVAGSGVNFTVGQFVLVRSVAQTTVSGVYVPHFGHFCKVTAVTANTITINDPIPEDVSAATISPIGGVVDASTGLEWNIVENVRIINPTVDARGIVWTRTGCYNCELTNVNIENGSIPFAVNAFVRSSLRGLRSGYDDRFVELKCLSHNSEIIDVKGQHNETDVTLIGVEIGEQSRDIAIDRCDCKAHVVSGTAGYALGIGGRRIRIYNSNFMYTGANASGNGVTAFIKSSDSYGEFPFDDIKIEDTTFIGDGNRTHNLRLGLSTTTATTGKVVLDNVKFVGTPSIKDVRLERNGDTFVLNESADVSYELSSTGAPVKSLSKEDTLLSTNDFDSLDGVTALATYGASRAKAWSFADAATTYVYTTIPVRANSVVNVRLYLVNMSAEAGNAVFSVSASPQAVGGTALSSSASSTKTITLNAQDVITSESFSFTCTNADAMLIRISRVGADANDTLAGAVGLVCARVVSI